MGWLRETAPSQRIDAPELGSELYLLSQRSNFYVIETIDLLPLEWKEYITCHWSRGGMRSNSGYRTATTKYPVVQGYSQEDSIQLIKKWVDYLDIVLPTDRTSWDETVKGFDLIDPIDGEKFRVVMAASVHTDKVVASLMAEAIEDMQADKKFTGVIDLSWPRGQHLVENGKFSALLSFSTVQGVKAGAWAKDHYYRMTSNGELVVPENPQEALKKTLSFIAWRNNEIEAQMRYEEQRKRIASLKDSFVLNEGIGCDYVIRDKGSRKCSPDHPLYVVSGNTLLQKIELDELISGSIPAIDGINILGLSLDYDLGVWTVKIDNNDVNKISILSEYDYFLLLERKEQAIQRSFQQHKPATVSGKDSPFAALKGKF